MRKRAKQPVAVLTTIFAHTTAVAFTFAVFCALFLTEASVGLLSAGLRDVALRSSLLPELALLLGLAACAWGLIYIVISLLRMRVAPSPTKLKKARGTVVVETLIVLPVFLLLTFGLGQMAINSMAGLLTTLATFQVTRSLAVWSTEVGQNRAGSAVTNGVVSEKARIAAAAVIAPVVPESRTSMGSCSPSIDLTRLRTGMASTGVNADPTGQADWDSFARALGETTFAERAPTKLSLGYCAVHVSWTPVSSSLQHLDIQGFTATVSYHHPAAFPLVGPIFTDPDFSVGTSPWASDFVTTITRQYNYTTYLTPNRCTPGDMSCD